MSSLVMGIVGLPNVGKSSLFNVLTNGNALVENRPFATIDPNLGIVKLEDDRIDQLASIIKPKKITHSFVKFLDIAGLVKGASKGEGLGNKFLENIRGSDAICLVVRVFGDKDVFSTIEDFSPNPVLEAEIILLELIYSDADMIDNIMRKLKKNDEKLELLHKLKNHLQDGKLINNFEFTDKEKQILNIFSFLTKKPIILLANVDDSPESQKSLIEIQEYAKKIGASFLEMNIKLEREIMDLPESDREELLKSFGRTDTCLNRFVRMSFETLGLSTFFTAGEQEVRSWTFKTGSTAAECAGLIHTDMQRGFIKAKVAKFEDFVVHKDFKNLKQQGKLFLEGKTYIMQDGDIVHFEFNV